MHLAQLGEEEVLLLLGDQRWQLDELQATHRKWHATFVKKLLADAEKEYDLVARFGYGVDGDADIQSRDFEAVRGTFDTNSFVRQMKDRLDDYD